MSEWPLVPLAQLARVDRGASWGKEQERADGSGVPVIRIANVQPEGLDLSDVRSVSGIKERDLARSMIRPETLLMVGSNGNPERIGNVYAATSPIIGASLASFLIGIHGQSVLEAQWLRCWLGSESVQRTLTGATAGSTGLKNLSLEWVREMLVPSPTVAEKRRIVDLIGALDAHVEMVAAEALALLEYLDTLRDRLTGPSIEWPLITLGQVLTIARGGSPRPIDDYFTEEATGINWIKIGDVPPGGKYIDRTAQRIRPAGASRSRRVAPGDFLLSNSMSFGRPYILRIDGCVHDGWLVLSDPRKAFDQDFLYNALRSGTVQEQFAALAAGSAVKNLNIKVVSTVAVPAPPMGEQTRIGSILNATEETRLRLVTEVEELRVVRATVLHALLSGALEIPESYDDLLEAV